MKNKILLLLLIAPCSLFAMEPAIESISEPLFSGLKDLLPAIENGVVIFALIGAGLSLLRGGSSSLMLAVQSIALVFLPKLLGMALDVENSLFDNSFFVVSCTLIFTVSVFVIVKTLCFDIDEDSFSYTRSPRTQAQRRPAELASLEELAAEEEQILAQPSTVNDQANSSVARVVNLDESPTETANDSATTEDKTIRKVFVD